MAFQLLLGDVFPCYPFTLEKDGQTVPLSINKLQTCMRKCTSLIWEPLCIGYIPSNFNLRLTIFSCLFELATKIDHFEEINHNNDDS